MIDAHSITILSIAILLFFGISIIILSVRIFSSKSITHRLSEYVDEADDEGGKIRRVVILPEDRKGSLANRVVVPFLRNISKLFGKIAPAQYTESTKIKLSIAGNPMGMQILEFNGLRIVVFFIGIIMGMLVIVLRGGFDIISILLAVVVIFISIVYPVVWLDGSVKRMKLDIQTGFPDVLDLLSVCSSAGLGFDQALQRVSEMNDSPIGYEMRRAVQEMELGVSRSTALNDMSKRLEISDITNFVAIITQSEMLGMSISDVLHSQAEQMRIIRTYRAKEIANQLPAKMLIPLAIFILPALFALIFAPIIPNILGILK